MPDSHSHHHHHHHHHHGALTGRRMAFSVGLTLAFVVGESVAGLFSHSLALLSDAGHNFADALALLLAWYALGAARRPANASRTFGYHRVGILAALANAITLVVIALLIFWEAFQRLRSPAPVQSGLMIGVALAALLMNTVISLGLRGEAKHDLNVRSAYLHMVGDALSSLGVVVAGVMIAFTGSTIADPAVSLLIGTLILWSSGGILTEAITVLLEAAPSSLDMEALEQEIQTVSGVIDVHDLHVWSVATGIIACSCHILVAEQSIRSGQQVLRGVAELLEQRFGITHTTVQVEVEGCEPNDMYCTMRHAHHH
jgi:cobalt-zinc-cadmium efflux system protein